MRRLTALFAAALLAVPALHAQTLAEGEVRKIDKPAAKITLKHGEIKALDMPPMTMVYRAQPPSLLEGLRVGDTVRFAAEKRDGAYTVTRIEVVR